MFVQMLTSCDEEKVIKKSKNQFLHRRIRSKRGNDKNNSNNNKVDWQSWQVSERVSWKRENWVIDLQVIHLKCHILNYYYDRIDFCVEELRVFLGMWLDSIPTSTKWFSKHVFTSFTSMFVCVWAIPFDLWCVI
jgi:hypothetical protein